MNASRLPAYDRQFDAEYRYDGGDLGCRCAGGRTTFKLWSPMAERVELSLYRESGCDVRPLERSRRGVWSLALEEDLHGVYYDYAVWTDGECRRTADPYAVACGCNGAPSMVADLSRTDPEGFERDVPPPVQPENVIYELHVKDFSFDPDSGVPEACRGKFKAFSWRDGDGNVPLCVEHLKSLGVTHVQLLPIFDFGSVDEAGNGGQFNWGYDPMNYNVPEGSYSTDPADGAVRIRECKEMVQALHQNGLRVVMDVVYNHTYSADSWLERSAPGYFYRRNPDGTLSDGSACGNDIAAGRAMVDNYIVNSVLYWAREYHIDGFRFDLMGLLTVELMNRIRTELDNAFGPGEKLIYGEPWRAADSPMEPGTRPALKAFVSLLDPGVGVFCDSTRDAIKGSVFLHRAPGFVNGGEGLEEDILCAASGWSTGGYGFAPRSCSQIVNYVSAHDNFTLWDKLVMTLPENLEAEPLDFASPRPEALARNKLAAFICFTCQGHLFFQAGEEFGRTKLGEGNSYCSPPELNMLDWARARRFSALTEYYRELIRLRKSLPGLCAKSPAAARLVTNRTVHRPFIVSFEVEEGGPQGERLLVAYNASAEAFSLPLPDGQWTVRADGACADQYRAAPPECASITVPPCSGMLLLRRDPAPLRSADGPRPMPAMKYRDCVFDLYGTLVDIHTDEDAPALWEAMAEEYTRHGAAYRPEELHLAYRRAVEEALGAAPGGDAHEAHPEIRLELVFRRLFREKGADGDLELAVRTGRRFRALSTGYIRLYDGAAELLRALRERGRRVWLLSNAQAIFTRWELEHLGIDALFDGIYLSSDYGVKKPGHRFFDVLLRERGIDPAHAVMVGNDGSCDVGGGKGAGLDTVYLRSNLSPREPLPPADYVLEEMDLRRVLDILTGS